MDIVDAVVHLAAIAAEDDFETAVDTHRPDSSCTRGGGHQQGHAGGVRQRQPRRRIHAADIDARGGPGPDPDSFYGFGKAACKGLCSLYRDRHGLGVACLRIGGFRDRPATRRHLSTWLSR